MRVILDTNTVIASAWKSSGDCRRVLDALFHRKLAVCYVSPAIVQEYEETARYPKFGHLRRELSRQFRRVKRHARSVVPRESVTILSDPDDDKFLELAKAVKADSLITGDLEAFGQLHSFGETRILTPHEFLAVLEKAALL